MSGEQKGHKAAMLVPGYGTLYLHVVAVGYGITIVPGGEPTSRYGKTLYINAKTAGSFNMDLVFFDHEAFEQFSKVMLHYGENLARGIVGSPCRVMIPSIKDAKGKGFDRVGIPSKSGIPFGDAVATVVHKATLDFIGTSDPYSPVGVTDVAKVSNLLGAEYLQAIKKDPMAAYYYPSGSQLSGSTYGKDTLYDSVPSESGGFEESEDPASILPGSTATHDYEVP
jgi:hypothetical protein